MIKIPLVGKFKSHYALVDDQDAWVLRLRWKGMRVKVNLIYAKVSSRKEGLNNIFLHRLILGLKPGDPDVDHWNGDCLDNTRSNLRLVTKSQNSMNQQKTIGVSKYKGVYWSKQNKKWQVAIKKEQRRIYLGLFISGIEAAKAYDAKAKELFGEFARLNFPG